MADIGKFLEKETAGIPNWGWAIVIVVGIGAAIFVPKLLNRSPQNSTDSGTPNSDIGLAIDPATGLPYAVEGLVPSGGTAGGPSGAGTNVDLTATNNLLQQLLQAQQAQNGTSNGTGNHGGGAVSTVTNILARARMGSSNGAGIGVRSQPGGSGTKTIRNIAFGAPVMIIGPAVNGGPNNAVTPGVAQSNQWYPVQGGGYVSAADVVISPTPEASAGAKTGGTTGAVSPAHFNVSEQGVGQVSFTDQGLNVQSGGDSVSINGDDVKVVTADGSTGYSNTFPSYVPMQSWPYVDQSFQHIAAQRGMSFERLFNLNPHLYDSNHVFSGQQVRVN